MRTIYTPGVVSVAIILALIFVALIYAVSGLLFALAWNFVVPLFWHTAPHLSWLHGVALAWLVGIVKSIFGGIIKVEHKES